MRKYILVVALVVVTSLSAVNAQTKETIVVKNPIEKEIIQPTAGEGTTFPMHSLIQPTNDHYKIMMAVKTNVALMAAGVSNIGAEIAFCNHYSVDVLFIYSPYTIKRDYNLRIIALQPEFRYWLKESMQGHFFGVHGTVGWFNVAMDSKNRYQDNRPLWGVGVSYGYLLPLNKHWGAEFTIGGGYANIGYDTYYNIKNGAKFDSNTKNYWGITRVGVNLVYKFNLK